MAELFVQYTRDRSVFCNFNKVLKAKLAYRLTPTNLFSKKRQIGSLFTVTQFKLSNIS